MCCIGECEGCLEMHARVLQKDEMCIDKGTKYVQLHASRRPTEHRIMLHVWILHVLVYQGHILTRQFVQLKRGKLESQIC